MKTIVFLLSFGLALYFMGCEKKCGDDIQHGTKLLTENSKTWLVDPDQLHYLNLDGDRLIFSKTESSDDLAEDPKVLCGGGSLYGGSKRVGQSLSLIKLQYMMRVYTAGERKLTIRLMVMPESDSNFQTNHDILYDRIFYTLAQLGNYADVVLTTDDRGSPSCTGSVCYPFYPFDEVEINGKIYENGWYDDLNEPSFYVTKKLGVIAFTDPDGTVWNIVE